MQKRNLLLFISVLCLFSFSLAGPVYSSGAVIKISSLDYSCWRWQSDSRYPVFIKKRKPVFDLFLKINRCFVGKPGYAGPSYIITYDYSGGDNTKFTAEVSREQWILLNKGCYRVSLSDRQDMPVLVDFVRVSCEKARLYF